MSARRPDPPPYQANEYLPVITGTALWLAAFGVLLVRHPAMNRRGDGWWLWVAATGFGLGLWGLTMLALRHRSLRRKARQQADR
jgi:hypothetical protein